MGFSKYPTQLDDNTTLPLAVDLVTPVNAECVNRTRDAVISIETELGTDPSSSFGTVRARLDDLTNQINTLKALTGISDAQQLELDALQVQVDALSDSFDAHVVTFTTHESLFTSHTSNTSNPHSVTAAQAGAPNKLGSSTDEAIMRFDGISGQMQDSSAGPFVTNTGDFRMVERTGDPANVADSGLLYTKEVSAITELFYIDSAGNATQLTIVGGSPVTGTGADEQLMRWNGTNAAQGSVISATDAGLLSWADSAVTPIIQQAADDTNLTGDLFTINSQDLTTITGTKVAGAMLIRAGDCTGGSSNTGGDLDIRPGSGDAADGVLTLQSGDSTDRFTIDADGDIQATAAADFTVIAVGASRLFISGTQNIWGTDIVSFDNFQPSPTLRQNDDTSGGAGATGGLFTLHAQNVTGSGTDNVGGAMLIRAGDSTNGASTNTGGDLDIRPGSGVTANGDLALQDGDGTDRLTISNILTHVIGGNNIVLSAGGGSNLTFGLNACTITAPSNYIINVAAGFLATTRSLTIQASDNAFAVGSVSGGDFFLSAGDCTGAATDNTGGAFNLQAGDASGAGSNIGGDLNIRPGSGATANGALELQDGGEAPRITIDAGGEVDINSTIVRTTGSIILPNNTIFGARNNADDADVAVVQVTTSDNIIFGSTSSTGSVFFGAGASQSINFQPNGAAVQFTMSGTLFTVGVPTIRFATGVVNPIFHQQADTTDGGGGGITGDLFTLHSQDVTGSGTDNIGGALLIRGGNSTNGASTNTGGDLTLNAGSGATADGDINIGVATTLAINFGNVTDNPTFNFLGTGDITYAGDMVFAEDVVTPMIYQADEDDAGISGDLLTIHAQDSTSTGSKAGGAMLIRAGDATGGTDTGGDLTLRPGVGDTDGILDLQDGGGTSRITINAGGDIDLTDDDSFISVDDEIRLDSLEPLLMYHGGALSLSVTSTSIDSNAPIIGFFRDVAAPQIFHTSNNTTGGGGGVTGELFTFHSQDVTGSGTTNVGGALLIRSGDATGGGSTNTGGDLDIRPGSGATVNGILALQDGGGTDRISVLANGNTQLNAAGSHTIIVTGASRMSLTPSIFTISVGKTSYGRLIVAPILNQADETAANGTGELFTFHSQDVTGAGTTLNTGGALLIRAGDSTTGTNTNETGGVLTLRGGTGGTGTGVAGHVQIDDSTGAEKFRVNDTGVIWNDNVQFAATVVNPTISQEDEGGAGLTGADFRIFAQASLGTGVKAGGSMEVAGGDAVNGTDTGGAILLRSGDGDATLDGLVTLSRGSGTGQDLVINESTFTLDHITEIDLQIGGSNMIAITSASIVIVPPLFEFAEDTVSPTIRQADEDDSGIGGDLMTIHSQDSIGAGSKDGGDLTIRAGDALNGDTNTGGDVLIAAGDGYGGGGDQFGGNLVLQVGAGADGDGFFELQDASGTSRLTLEPSGTTISFGVAAVQFETGVGNITINQAAETGAGVNGDSLTIAAQDSTGTGSKTGGAMIIQAGGATGGTDTGGDLDIRGGAGDVGGNVLIKGGAGSTTDGNVAMHILPASWQAMEGGMFLADRVAAPTADPAAGGYMYSESGAGKWRGPSGTITTFGLADPHCPTCGRDSALEWKNEKEGWELSVCMWCITDAIGNIGLIKKEQK